MDRITADELDKAFENEGLTLFQAAQLILRAAYTIEEMDKDIAVMEHQIDDMQREHYRITDGVMGLNE